MSSMVLVNEPGTKMKPGRSICVQPNWPTTWFWGTLSVIPKRRNFFVTKIRVTESRNLKPTIVHNMFYKQNMRLAFWFPFVSQPKRIPPQMPRASSEGASRREVDSTGEVGISVGTSADIEVWRLSDFRIGTLKANLGCPN